jgi:hypothetical protein
LVGVAEDAPQGGLAIVTTPMAPTSLLLPRSPPVARAERERQLADAAVQYGIAEALDVRRESA